MTYIYMTHFPSAMYPGDARQQEEILLKALEKRGIDKSILEEPLKEIGKILGETKH